MAQKFVKSFRGIIRGHLQDVRTTINQCLQYQAKHSDRLPPLLTPEESTAFSAVMEICQMKIAQLSPKA